MHQHPRGDGRRALRVPRRYHSFVYWAGWTCISVVVAVVLALLTTTASSAGDYTSTARTCAEKLHTAANAAATVYYEAQKYDSDPTAWKISPARAWRDVVYDVYRACGNGRCDYYRSHEHDALVTIVVYAEATQLTGHLHPDVEGKVSISELTSLAVDSTREAEDRALGAANRAEPRQMSQVARNWFCSGGFGQVPMVRD